MCARFKKVIIEFAQRHADKAKEMAESESNPERRKELEMIAEVCSHVPGNAPRNFWEALQAYWFVHLGIHFVLASLTIPFMQFRHFERLAFSLYVSICLLPNIIRGQSSQPLPIPRP